jgi:transcriptional regulator with XRE-family HTH domain
MTAPVGDETPTRLERATTARGIVGAWLRRCREAQDLTIEHVAASIGTSPDKLIGLELGRVPFTMMDVRDLARLYEAIDSVEYAACSDMARRGATSPSSHDDPRGTV